MKNIYLLIFVVFLTSCTYSAPQYGVKDDLSKQGLNRINSFAKLRTDKKYNKLEIQLLAAIQTYQGNDYALPRLYYELAELYSYQLLDIEKAIKFDQKVLNGKILDTDPSGDFAPKHLVASQTILSDRGYYDKFVLIDKANMMKKAGTRVAKNHMLVKGKRPAGKKYSTAKLNKHLHLVKTDLDSGTASDLDKNTLISRLIRVEYEIRKINSKYKMKSPEKFKSGEISSDSVDLGEIDFLSLADYFNKAYQQSGEIIFAEYALETVYLPYLNLRNKRHRWQYNTLINGYVSTLIKANHKQKHYDEMLYYISLNKSRMLLEERLAFDKQMNGKSSYNLLQSNVKDGETQVEKNGLPAKKWFFQKLSSTDGFLDIYVDGRYSTQKKEISVSANRAAMPLTARDVGAANANQTNDVFVDSAIYFTYVGDGKVKKVKKMNKKELKQLKKELNGSFSQINNLDKTPRRSTILKRMRMGTRDKDYLVISPDKWVARHPLNYHFDAEVVRAVNIFTLGNQKKLKKMKLTGFFNPTLDLPGAEAEAAAINQHFNGANIYSREQAVISKLNGNSDANILHLSMHGSFDANSPKKSKLYFANAKLEVGPGDPNALYAEDMGSFDVLKNRQLIFAAACETGKIAADQENETELLGILRPLTANRNQNVILSLWQVSDDATRDFVDWFYADLSKSRSVEGAFLYAQKMTRKKYPEPYFWAPFYLSQSN